jgi:hypothetical protein
VVQRTLVQLILRLRRDPKTTGGSRRQESVKRVMERAERIVGDHPAWAVATGANYTHTATIGTASAQLGPKDFLPTQVIRYDGVVPGSAARMFAEQFHDWLDKTAGKVLQEATARTQQLIRAIERLVHDLNIAVAENENLRARLHDANLEIEFLRRQVDQLSESLKTGRPSIAKAMLAAVSAILLAAIAGVAEGSAGQLVGGSPATTVTQVTEFVERCDSLIGDLKALEAEHGDRWPSGSHGD